MRNGYISEACVLAGAYLSVQYSVALGLSILFLGIASGFVSFLVNASLHYAKERRTIESFEIAKTIILKIIQVANEITSSSHKDGKVVH